MVPITFTYQIQVILDTAYQIVFGEKRRFLEMEIVSIRANSDAIDTEKSMELKTLTAIPHHSESTSTKLKVEEDVHNEPEQIRRNCWVRSVESVEVWAEKFLASYRQVILAGLKVVTALLYLAFVCYSWYYR